MDCFDTEETFKTGEFGVTRSIFFSKIFYGRLFAINMNMNVIMVFSESVSHTQSKNMDTDKHGPYDCG